MTLFRYYYEWCSVGTLERITLCLEFRHKYWNNKNIIFYTLLYYYLHYERFSNAYETSVHTRTLESAKNIVLSENVYYTTITQNNNDPSRYSVVYKTKYYTSGTAGHPVICIHYVCRVRKCYWCFKAKRWVPTPYNITYIYLYMYIHALLYLQ